MHYLVWLEVDWPEDAKRLSGRDDVFLTPDGEQGWAILEAENEDYARGELGVRKIREVQAVLPAGEYAALREARENIEEVKARFVDDPSGALEEARKQVRLVLEKQGYPVGNAGEVSGERGGILRDYERTDLDESASVEEKRKAFNSLPDLLERVART